jgi:hypothetical protein
VASRIETGDPNPIRYLWRSLNDGFFQEGPGHHLPTYAIKVDLTEQQFYELLHFIEDYPYQDYSLTKHQCCTFVTEVARLADLNLECEICMKIGSTVRVGRDILTLWSDPAFSEIKFPCPEVLELSMEAAVANGKADEALNWYLASHPIKIGERWSRFCQDFPLLPSRLNRLLLFNH